MEKLDRICYKVKHDGEDQHSILREINENTASKKERIKHQRNKGI